MDHTANTAHATTTNPPVPDVFQVPHAPCPVPPPHPNPADAPPNWSPADLFRDLLNPNLTLLDLCEIHRLTLPQLETLLAHDWLAARLAAFQRLNTLRADLIRSNAQPQAAQTLADLCLPLPPIERPRERVPEGRVRGSTSEAPPPSSLPVRLAETRRKAATRLLVPPTRASRTNRRVPPADCQPVRSLAVPRSPAHAHPPPPNASGRPLALAAGVGPDRLGTSLNTRDRERATPRGAVRQRRGASGVGQRYGRGSHPLHENGRRCSRSGHARGGLVGRSGGIISRRRFCRGTR